MNDLRKEVEESGCFETLQSIFIKNGAIDPGMQSIQSQIKRDKNTSEKYNDWVKTCQSGDIMERLIKHKGSSIMTKNKQSRLSLANIMPDNILAQVNNVVKRSNDDIRKSKNDILYHSLEVNVRRYALKDDRQVTLDFGDEIKLTTQHSKDPNDDLTMEEYTSNNRIEKDAQNEIIQNR